MITADRSTLGRARDRTAWAIASWALTWIATPWYRKALKSTIRTGMVASAMPGANPNIADERQQELYTAFTTAFTQHLAGANDRTSKFEKTEAMLAGINAVHVLGVLVGQASTKGRE